MYYEEWSCAWSNWTRQALSDPWDATNWSGLCGTPWQMVATTLKLTKKVKGLGPSIAKDIEAHGHTGELSRLCTARHGRAINRTTTNLEKESERLMREP